MHIKLIPDPFLILVNDPKQPFKMLSLFFLSNPVPFTGQGFEKQKGALGTSDQLLFRLENTLRKVPLLVIYYLTKFDDVIQSGF